MNIAAEEAGKRQCILGKPVNPQNLVHRFGALYCCTTIDERRKEQTFMISFFFFFSPSTTRPTILWEWKHAACSARFVFLLLLIFFSVCFFPQIWCLDLVLHYKPEYRELYLGGKNSQGNIVVYILRRNVAVYLQIL